jgi:hypothetical protein
MKSSRQLQNIHFNKRLKKLSRDKHSSLLGKYINLGQKSCIILAPGAINLYAFSVAPSIFNDNSKSVLFHLKMSYFVELPKVANVSTPIVTITRIFKVYLHI